MARDYAKQVNAVRKSAKKSKRLDIFVVSFMLLAIFCGCYVFYVYKLRPEMENKSISSLFAAIKLTFHHPKMIAEPVKPKPVIENPPEVHFDFYNQLPNMQVQIHTAQAAEVTPTQPGYILQFGIYNNLNEATEARISYLLAGADANVVKIGNTYRIQQGPYLNMVAAKKIQKKLQAKGIETLIRKS